MNTKKYAAIVGGLILLVFFVYFGIGSSAPSISAIKEEARRASVQPLFDVPILRASFAYPLQEEDPLDRRDLERLIEHHEKSRAEMLVEIEARIEAAIQEERAFQSRPRHRSYLTDLDVYGVEPYGGARVPLGAIAPEGARFPECVLVVYEIETTELSPWNEHDVMVISEQANVSPKAAREILSRLQMEGYSVSKGEVESDAEVALLHFRSGWGDPNPVVLKWSVTLEGHPGNLLTGYDPRGILEVRTTPEGRTVRVQAGYFELLDEYKPKASELIQAEKEIEDLKAELARKEAEWAEQIKALKEALEDKKDPSKRDITRATMLDVISGRVKLELLWFRTAASGISLGSHPVQEGMSTDRFWDVDVLGIGFEERSFILTNAHVAEMAITYRAMASKDREVMWIQLPALAKMRHTRDSDMHGSPASLLAIDGQPVSSWDYDCAVMVSNQVPGYDHSVQLGDSDEVREGDEVVAVGNPSMMQKFLTEGVVSNTDYTIMKSHLMDRSLSRGYIHRGLYNWLLNSNFWIDTPIGIGGVSGSGVWATSGSQAGKVIALRNMGMGSADGLFSAPAGEGGVIDPAVFQGSPHKGLRLESLTKDHWRDCLSLSSDGVRFSMTADEFFQEHPSFTLLSRGRVSGMSGGIKINFIKRYLQERGLDPAFFGWDGADESYWLR